MKQEALQPAKAALPELPSLLCASRRQQGWPWVPMSPSVFASETNQTNAFWRPPGDSFLRLS